MGGEAWCAKVAAPRRAVDILARESGLTGRAQRWDGRCSGPECAESWAPGYEA